MTQLNSNQINLAVFADIFHAALTAIAANKRLTDKQAARWTNAIIRAQQEAETNPFYSFDGETLTLLSPTSQTIYEVKRGQPCTCTAAQTGQPCKHRAMLRLLELYQATISLPHTDAGASPESHAPASARPAVPPIGHVDTRAAMPASNAYGETYGAFQI